MWNSASYEKKRRKTALLSAFLKESTKNSQHHSHLRIAEISDKVPPHEHLVAAWDE
jgi:hypothetical protein